MVILVSIGFSFRLRSNFDFDVSLKAKGLHSGVFGL